MNPYAPSAFTGLFSILSPLCILKQICFFVLMKFTFVTSPLFFLEVATLSSVPTTPVGKILRLYMY